MAINAREIGIRTPCNLDFRKMTPADGGRFCGDCKKVVRDLSSMTEAEARALLGKPRHEELCVRMIVDRDGNVFFGRNPLVAPALLSRARRAAAAAAALALPLAGQACSIPTELTAAQQQESREAPSDDSDPDQETYESMGGVSAPPLDSTGQDGGDAEASDAGADAPNDAASDAAPEASFPPFD